MKLIVRTLIVLVCFSAVAAAAQGVPQQIMIGTTTVMLGLPPATTDQALLQDVTEKDPAKKVKILANKMGSSISMDQQSSARSQLLKMGKAAVPYLNDVVINDNRTYTRIQVANILGKIKDISSIPALEAAATSQYKLLNQTAVKNIALIGTEKAAAALGRIKSITPDLELIKTIDEALKNVK